jgi:transcription elongation factor Elf1
MLEHFFQCPYCWEEISMLLDASVDKQTYVEDCEVCCNPIEVSTQFVDQELQGFQAVPLEQ